MKKTEILVLLATENALQAEGYMTEEDDEKNEVI